MKHFDEKRIISVVLPEKGNQRTNQKEKKVSVGYSRSGIPGITDFYIVGSYNPSDAKRWSRKHSPSERKFALYNSSKSEYEFKYYDEWISMSYAIDINGKKMVMGGNN